MEQTWSSFLPTEQLSRGRSLYPCTTEPTGLPGNPLRVELPLHNRPPHLYPSFSKQQVKCIPRSISWREGTYISPDCENTVQPWARRIRDPNPQEKEYDGRMCDGLPERNLAFLYSASTAEQSKWNSTEFKAAWILCRKKRHIPCLPKNPLKSIQGCLCFQNQRWQVSRQTAVAMQRLVLSKHFWRMFWLLHCLAASNSGRVSLISTVKEILL